MPPNTHCPKEYIGIQAFVARVSDVKNLYSSDNNKKKNLGYITDFARDCFNVKDFKTEYLVLSWEDINAMINFTRIPQNSLDPALAGISREDQHKRRKYDEIIRFISTLIPCVVSTTHTLTLTGSLSAKIPVGVRDLNSFSFGIIKTKYIRKITVETPYFSRQPILRSSNSNIQKNFYYLVPMITDPTFMNIVNHYAYELASSKSGSDINTPSSLSSYVDSLPEAEREQFPLYKYKSFQSTSFATCTGPKRVVDPLAYVIDRWTKFSSLNYYMSPIVIQSHYHKIGKITDVSGVEDRTFFDSAFAAKAPKHVEIVDTAPKNPTPAKKKKTSEPTFL